MRTHAVIGAVLGILLTANAETLRGEAGKETGTERVSRLIKQLGDNAFAKREAASKELDAIGEPALGALRKAAASDGDVEIRRRAEQVIKTIAERITKRELEKLQGQWGLASLEMNGKRNKAETHVFTFNGEKWSLHINGQLAQAGTVQRIEVDEKFNAIDLLITEGGGAGLTGISIYTLEGESLRYVNGDPRPNGFTTKVGDGRVYLTLRRGKS